MHLYPKINVRLLWHRVRMKGRRNVSLLEQCCSRMWHYCFNHRRASWMNSSKERGVKIACLLQLEWDRTATLIHDWFRKLHQSLVIRLKLDELFYLLSYQTSLYYYKIQKLHTKAMMHTILHTGHKHTNSSFSEKLQGTGTVRKFRAEPASEFIWLVTYVWLFLF